MGLITLQSLLVVVAVNAAVDAKFYSAAIARERLSTDLFVDYNPNMRPAPKGEVIALLANIELQHFDFRESDGAFHLVGLLDVSWYDKKLAWNPKFYNNLTKIPVSQKAVWVPDLEVYNNAPDKFLRMHRNGIVVLQYDGQLMWSDAIEITAFCTTNMRNWPHDSHVCKLSLGSWTYDGFDLDITNADPNTTMSFDNIDTTGMEYRIVNFTAVHNGVIYSCCAEPYYSIDYHITFERRAAFAVIFRVPALCVILLSLLALAMEPWRSEKIWLNGVSLIIITFNLIYFASNTGKFARKTPLIVIFYSSSLVLVTLAHLISVFALMATRARFRGKLPFRVSSFLKSRLAQFIVPMQLESPKQEHAEFEDVKLQEFSNLICTDQLVSEWTHLAKVSERMALIVLGSIYLILGSTCFV